MQKPISIVRFGSGASVKQNGWLADAAPKGGEDMESKVTSDDFVQEKARIIAPPANAHLR